MMTATADRQRRRQPRRRRGARASRARASRSASCRRFRRAGAPRARCRDWLERVERARHRRHRHARADARPARSRARCAARSRRTSPRSTRCSRACARRRRWTASISSRGVTCSAALRVDRADVARRRRRPRDCRRRRSQFHVVAYDFGIKENILRQLRDIGCARHGRAGDRRRRATCSRSAPTASSCRTAPAIRRRSTTASRRRAS